MGGIDFDENYMKFKENKLENNNIDPKKSTQILPGTRSSFEKAKIELSYGATNKTRNMIYKRYSEFEEANEKLFFEIYESINIALGSCAYFFGDGKRNKTIITGGSTKIPYLEFMIRERFISIKNIIVLENSVVVGAAIVAALRSGNDDNLIRHFRFSDIMPISLGIGTRGEDMSVIFKRLQKV